MGKRHPGDAYFDEVAEHLGEAYLRYSFTKGTDQEVSFLLNILKLPTGARLLDVGCGPGRHSIPLARAGLDVTGVDVSRRFLDVAAERAREAEVGVSFFEVDARRLPFDDEFDAVVSICQGAFGLMGADDSLVLKRMAEAARPGAWVVVTAFSAYFEAGHRRAEADFDVDSGIVHEKSTIKDPGGTDKEVDLWTGVYTPRELRLLAIGVGLVPEAIWSVEPGNFGRRPPDLEHPEFMLVARKPHLS
ncbi:MAG: methyltransferase domain-containing protein [Actinomycetota bacterium]|nr:methyltransferase domain-containing protein [Actinomycetota bacterium]